MNKKQKFNQINQAMSKTKIKDMSGQTLQQERKATFFKAEELEKDGHYVCILSGRAVLCLGEKKFKYLNTVTGEYMTAEANDHQLYRMN